jgi:hypothetical protein
MNDRTFHEDPGPSRKFAPGVNALENRTLLSSASHELPIRWDPNLPRTGGISVQSGTVVSIGVGQPQGNTVQINDNEAGDVQGEWNGGPVHSFTGVSSTVIQAERARSNQITFHLTGPRPSPTAVAVGSHLPADVASAREVGHPLRKIARTSGTAVQSGSILTVTVNRPTTNVVQINNQGEGAVQVEWNGAAVHSFTEIETIVVDTQNARKDQVTLTDPAS